MKAAAGPRTNSNISKLAQGKKKKKRQKKLTFDSLATVKLDLPLPLRRVGLHHDEGASWDSAVEFALRPAGAC